MFANVRSDDERSAPPKRSKRSDPMRARARGCSASAWMKAYCFDRPAVVAVAEGDGFEGNEWLFGFIHMVLARTILEHR
jgi:hypothetical protein